MTDYQPHPPDVKRSVIPHDERERLHSFLARSMAAVSIAPPDHDPLIPARRSMSPGPRAWYLINGARNTDELRQVSMLARGEGELLILDHVPFSFNADVRSILAVWRGRWQVAIRPSNARRIAAWLAWWQIEVDGAALELLRANARDAEVAS